MCMGHGAQGTPIRTSRGASRSRGLQVRDFKGDFKVDFKRDFKGQEVL